MRRYIMRFHQHGFGTCSPKFSCGATRRRYPWVTVQPLVANNRRRPHNGARPSATMMRALLLVSRSHSAACALSLSTALHHYRLSRSFCATKESVETVDDFVAVQSLL